MNRQLKVGLYMRVSKEDGDGESSSIRTQRILLRRFAEEHFGDDRILEFRDDGYSGLSLDRPGVGAMLELVKESALDCIIVKDFSRFSRDYIALGTYLEQIFPFMGIRFISVNDEYDSEAWGQAAGGMDVAFRSLMYNLYSKDLSIKVRSSLEARKERGQFISANCPFGYEKAPGDRHSLVIAQDEAEIVRRIFQMTMEGMTSSQIARAFNEEGVKTPMELRMEKGKAGRRGSGSVWRSSAVCAILKNQAYAGDMVYGKTCKDCVGGRNRVRPRSEWKVFRNHHAPIVDRELFEEVQKGRGGGAARETGARHPLSGRLICGCCGRRLYIRKGLNPYFCCPSLYDNPGKGCVRKVNAMFLEQLCLYELEEHLKEASGKLSWQEESRRELEQRLEKGKRERRRIRGQLQALKGQKAEIYEHYASNRKGDEWIGGSAGENLRDSLAVVDERIAETEARLWEMESLVDSIEAELGRGPKGLEAEPGIPELTQEVVQRFIRQILVRDEQDVEIGWRD